MKKSQKQLLSVLFHLAVLGCMVMLFDLVKPLFDKLNLGALVSSGEKKEESVEKASSDKIVKPVEKVSSAKTDIPAVPEKSDTGGGGKKITGGTTMADLMAQKAEQQRKKAEALKKKEE